ncbi:MAG: tRNA (N(6)-L-threonylcarbamoyladenosine(37)-C(2))-methylthiotransferase MtaB [Clostridiaceae bacterium]|nr:tRNA (N(6)-L-threonylcarbamoyladenosine(37)-C(2))-methylthiotransferase MtaB [Clostridiaceae bacterium]
MKFSFLTLGCKANQFDTQAMEAIVQKRGHTLCDTAPDVLVVNTCTVTGEADRKCRQTIRRARRENPEVLLAVCGCMAQTAPDAARMLGADIIGGSGDRHGFLDAIEEHFTGSESYAVPEHSFGERFEFLPGGELDERTRALLKVQDGCDNYCTYCIIPYARGHVRSMPLDIALAEVRRLRDEGFRECVITGIEISSYGRDLPGNPDLVTLVDALCKAAGTMRIHLGSLEPRTIDERFCDTLRGHENLCPHFHLSLQSGCDATLARMRRKYRTADFFRSTELLRAAFPNCLLSTDLITGFPGETDEEFAATLAFLELVSFGAAHIFPYSERRSTPAAAMPQLAKSIREARAREAIAVAARTKAHFLASQVGQTLSVLFEAAQDGVWHGHARNYVEVSVLCEEYLHNRELSVYVTRADENGVFGTFIL